MRKVNPHAPKPVLGCPTKASFGMSKPVILAARACVGRGKMNDEANSVKLWVCGVVAEVDDSVHDCGKGRLLQLLNCRWVASCRRRNITCICHVNKMRRPLPQRNLLELTDASAIYIRLAWISLLTLPCVYVCPLDATEALLRPVLPLVGPHINQGEGLGGYLTDLTLRPLDKN